MPSEIKREAKLLSQLTNDSLK